MFALLPPLGAFLMQLSDSSSVIHFTRRPSNNFFFPVLEHRRLVFIYRTNHTHRYSYSFMHAVVLKLLLMMLSIDLTAHLAFTHLNKVLLTTGCSNTAVGALKY